MKIEKIQKHMARRTVVIGESYGYPTTVGVIAQIDTSVGTARISGYVPPDSHDFNWYGFDDVRKATPDERAAFFAWLRENGRDTADGFKRFGGAPRGWSAITPVERAVFNAATPNDQRTEVVGKRVRILVAHTEANKGKIGQVTNVDNSRVPYLVSFGDGETGWAVEIEVIEDTTSAAPPAAPKRLTVGDAAIAVYDDGRAVMGKIIQDDQDGIPYRLEGTCHFHAKRTHPITLDGFRAAAAQQRAAGVMFEEGDYAAMIDNDGEVDMGVIFERQDGILCMRYGLRQGTVIKGNEDWSDRVVVLTKRPKI